MKRDRTTTKIFKKEKCQEILNKGFISVEDKPFLFELIKNHPDYDLKAGCGISDFFIKRTQWNNNGFYIKRLDGTETDFSYLVCLNPRTKLQKIKTACRSAIAEDMMKISRIGYVAHHETPFKEIFDQWIINKNIEELEINETTDNYVVTTFKDKRIAEDFRNFHNLIAEVKEVMHDEHIKIHFGDKK